MAVQKQSDLDWEDLRVFVALARAGTLSAAARDLRIGHATVARRVACLEAALGRALVERRPDGYVLTAEGDAVLELASAMHERALAIGRRAGRDGGLTGTVRLTATETIAERFLVPRLVGFRRRHPGIDLEVLADSRSLSLARREADVAVRLARPGAGDLFTRRLSGIAYGLYAAPGADPGCRVGYDDSLAHLPEAQWMARHMAGARLAFRANGVGALIAAARAGFGVALLPRWLAAEEPELVPVPAPAPPPVREAWLLVHRDLRDVPRVRALIDAVVAVFEAERHRMEA